MSLWPCPYTKSSFISGNASVFSQSFTLSISLLIISCEISIVLVPNLFCNSFAIVVLPLPELPLRIIYFCIFLPHQSQVYLVITQIIIHLAYRTFVRHNVSRCYHNGRRLVLFRRTVTFVYIEICSQKSYEWRYCLC